MKTEEPGRAAPWRRAYQAGLAPPAGGCPEDDALAALAAGELQGAERRRLADHVVACPRCADAYRTLRELDREAGGGAAPGRRGGVGLAGWMAAALVAGMAIVLLYNLHFAPPAETTLRDAGSSPAEVSAVLPADGARLGEPPRRFEWRPQADVASYRIVVYDEASVPVFESERVANPFLAMPADLRRRLAAGGTFYWRVRVESDRGASASPLYRFEVAP